MTKKPTSTEGSPTNEVDGNVEIEGEKMSPVHDPPRKRRRWGRRLMITALVLVLFYTLFGFFGVPLLIRTTGITQLNKRLNGTATLDRATFNPYTLELVLQGFSIVNDAGEPQIGFGQFDCNVQLIDTLFRDGYHLRHARLDTPSLLLDRDAEGFINLALLWIGSDQSSEPFRDIPRLVITDLKLTGADLVVRDEALDEPFERTISKLDFDIASLDTREDFENTHHLTAVLDDGGSIAWHGTFFADPLSTAGTLTVEGMQLKPFMPYATRFTNARITDGRLSFKLTYDFAPARQPRRASLAIVSAHLDELEIAIQGETIVTLPGMTIHEAHFDADAQRVDIQRIALTQPILNVFRDADGSLQLQTLLVTTTPGTGDIPLPGKSSPPSPQDDRVDVQTIEYEIEQLQVAIRQLVRDVLGPWEVELVQFDIDRADVEFVDASREPPVEISIAEATIHMGPLTLIEDRPVPFTLDALLDDGSVLKGEGESTLNGKHLALTIEGRDLDISRFATYMPLARIIPGARFDSGRLSFAGDGTIAKTGDVYETTYEGTATIADLDISSSETGRDVVVFDRLDLTFKSEAASRIDGVQSLRWIGRADLQSGAIEWPVAGGLLADAEQLIADVDLRVDLS
ncbi:MAG: DUF748 domain-containing protein, partial [Planctomycetota bacterium]|nr:DUF748 domain-containing protein [Planctomycetota bacterium]